MAVPLPLSPGQRLASVDALRGLTVAAMLIVNNPGDWGHVYAPLRHAEWHGCTFTDLIFPLFLFVAGVSLSLSLSPRLEAGARGRDLDAALAWRALKIIALGLAIHALAGWAVSAEHFRPMGVLQRIGLCVLGSGWLLIHTQPRIQWVVIAALLLGYWSLIVWGGTFEPWLNLASRIDALLLGPHAYEFDASTGRAHDPEGLLSTLPAIATTLLGVRAGDWLRRGETRALIALAAAGLAGGLLWSSVFPFNKNLWTSSYVMWTAGWAALALVIFHELIDHRGGHVGLEHAADALFAVLRLARDIRRDAGLVGRDQGLEGEALDPAVGPVELAGHEVEGVAEPSGLVVVEHLHAAREVPGRDDLGHGVGHRA